ncbi:MAG: hypothetical protein GY884_22910 [Proteobacteria bacterium]|nr:hypothetical protein [Pseudomonadota bacterium]
MKRWQPIVVGLALFGAVLAFVDAVRDSRDAEVGLVVANVDTVRSTVLAVEDMLGTPPRRCGSQDTALTAVASEDEAVRISIGACAQQTTGREEGPGPIWMEVAPGGVDFTVHGLARSTDGVVHIRASRLQAAEVEEGSTQDGAGSP